MIRAAMRRFLRKLGASLTAGLAQKKDIDDLYDQVAGLMQIQSAMHGGPVLKPLRVWVISPDAMAWVLAEIQERSDPVVVEFGSGQSTVILAACLKHKGRGRLLSIEHDAVHAAAVRRQLEACGLSSNVDLRVVPLIDYPVAGTLPASKSYALTGLPDVQVDVALIDGPPSELGDAARLHPAQWALSRLSAGGAVFLDDTTRSQERAVLAHLAAVVPDLAIDYPRAEKGLARCTRVTASARAARDGAGR
jgi:predicted O-methyltransferase YrrM